MTILAGFCPLVCVGGLESKSFAIIYQDDNPQLLPRMYLLFHVAIGSIVLLTQERYDVEEVPAQGGRAFLLHRFPDNCSCSVYIACNGQDHACDCGEVHSDQNCRHVVATRHLIDAGHLDDPRYDPRPDPAPEGLEAPF